MDSKDMIQLAGYTNPLLRGKKTRGMGGRSRGHVVRGRAWGKAAARRPELREKNSKVIIHMAGNTYVLRWGKQHRRIGSRSKGWVVRGRDWGKAATRRPKLQEMDSKGMIQLAENTYLLRRGNQTRGMGDKSRV